MRQTDTDLRTAPPTDGAPPTLHIATDDLPWIDLVDIGGGAVIIEGKMEIKPLFRDEEKDLTVVMSRMAPGTRTCTHLHLGPVTGYTFQGAWRYLEYDWVATAGSCIYEPPGSIHTLVVDGDEPAIVLFHVMGEIINYGPDGKVLEHSGLAGMSEADRQKAYNQA